MTILFRKELLHWQWKFCCRKVPSLKLKKLLHLLKKHDIIVKSKINTLYLVLGKTCLNSV